MRFQRSHYPVGWVVALALVLAMVACASFQTNAYKILASDKVIYQGIMSAAGDAYKQGLIGEEEKLEIIDLGNKYWAAHQSAATALEAYALGETDASKSRLEVALESAVAALGSLSDNWDLIKGGGE